MKLPDFLRDPALNELRERMGAAELGTFRLSTNPYRFTMAELEALIDGGIDVEDLVRVRPLADRTLCYKDRRVLLYRRDVAMLNAGRPLPRELPHFHAADCAIVRRLRAAERTARYVVSAREDGSFAVNLLRDGASATSLERLPICENCLAELGFDGFAPHLPSAARVRALAGFTVTRFFEKYRRALVADPGVSSQG
jgi:hypothetical protein